MPATVIINAVNDDGSSPSGVRSDKTSGTIRFKNADNATVDNNNPLVVPTTNREYSFEKWIQLEITGGSFTQVDNIQAYTDGDNASWGSPTLVKAWYFVAGTYLPAVVPAETNDPPQDRAAAAMLDLFLRTSGSRIDMDALNPGPYTATGQIGDFLVMVMEVEISATQGVLTAETLTITYDEI